MSGPTWGTSNAKSEEIHYLTGCYGGRMAYVAGHDIDLVHFRGMLLRDNEAWEVYDDGDWPWDLDDQIEAQREGVRSPFLRIVQDVVMGRGYFHTHTVPDMDTADCLIGWEEKPCTDPTCPHRQAITWAAFDDESFFAAARPDESWQWDAEAV